MEKFSAIPQEFHGLMLDSQLEKGCVAFMDYNKWNYEHEPEGYREGSVWYRPDFLLHGVNIIDVSQPCQSIKNADVFIEVKGDPKRLKEAYPKAKMMQRNGYHVIITGKFPHGGSNKEIIENMRNARDTCWENNQRYSTFTLFMACRQCGGTPHERKACEESFLKETSQRKNYDPALWDMYYHNLKDRGICPKSPRVLDNKYLWVGRNGEPIIGTWHKKPQRSDGDPANTAEAIKYANQIMNYKVKKGGN